MFLSEVLTDSLYLLALINPISKVSILAVISSQHKKIEFSSLVSKSSIAAGAILICSMFFGDIILRSIFHVELHSLKLAGGFVLFWTGFNALRKGVFFEQDTQKRFEEIALVPLACPMIAGPATITACIALHAKEGFLAPALSVAIALLINHFIMRMSGPISSLLTRFNILGAIVRITGLIVMTIGTQMALDGIKSCFAP